VTLSLDAPIPSPASRAPAIDRAGWNTARFTAMLLLAAAGVFAMRGAWEDIARIASRDEEASHIWFVPLLAIWLAWVGRKALSGARPASSLIGPVLVSLGWAMSHYGFYHAKDSPWHFGALLVVVGCIATVAGFRVLRAIWPAVLVLAFVVPVPGMVRQRMSIPLEQATAWVTCGLLHVAGLPVERLGNVITINRVPVTVAEACNGLRMIFPLFLIVYVFCFMLPLRAGVRWLLLLTSPISAVACNVLRLLPTVLLYGYASKSAADQFHNYSGWPMVMIAFIALMGVIKLLQMLGVPVMEKARSLNKPEAEAVGDAPGSPRSKWYLTPFFAPIASLLLLTGMTTSDKLRTDPHEADAFHARAAAAIAHLPKTIEAGRNSWYARKDIPLSDDAAALLQVNGYIHRVYVNPRTDRAVELMLVQCRDSRDMQGHYPPVCYRSQGCGITLPGDAQDWKLGTRVAGGPPVTPAADAPSIAGREYTVTWPGGQRMTIRNFFVLPNGKIARDMEGVNAAAKDHRELDYGVAQIQLLFDASVGAPERDQIFIDVIGSNQDLIATLRGGVLADGGRQ
jgi:exosortase